jgi:hypothetical protein
MILSFAKFRLLLGGVDLTITGGRVSLKPPSGGTILAQPAWKNNWERAKTDNKKGITILIKTGFCIMRCKLKLFGGNESSKSVKSVRF